MKISEGQSSLDISSPFFNAPDASKIWRPQTKLHMVNHGCRLSNCPNLFFICLWKHFRLKFSVNISLALQASKTTLNTLFVISFKYAFLPQTYILTLEVRTSIEVLLLYNSLYCITHLNTIYIFVVVNSTVSALCVEELPDLCSCIRPSTPTRV